jgi:hypothetical protein
VRGSHEQRQLGGYFRSSRRRTWADLSLASSAQPNLVASAAALGPADVEVSGQDLTARRQPEALGGWFAGNKVVTRALLKHSSRGCGPGRALFLERCAPLSASTAPRPAPSAALVVCSSADNFQSATMAVRSVRVAAARRRGGSSSLSSFLRPTLPALLPLAVAVLTPLQSLPPARRCCRFRRCSRCCCRC